MHASSLLVVYQSIVHQFPRWYIFHMIVMGNDRESGRHQHHCRDTAAAAVWPFRAVLGRGPKGHPDKEYSGVTLAETDKHDYSVNQYNYAAKAINPVEVSSPSMEMAGPEARRQPLRLRQYHQ